MKIIFIIAAFVASGCQTLNSKSGKAQPETSVECRGSKGYCTSFGREIKLVKDVL